MALAVVKKKLLVFVVTVPQVSEAYLVSLEVVKKHLLVLKAVLTLQVLIVTALVVFAAAYSFVVP